MPVFENSTPPPLWSSFPSGPRQDYHESSDTITPNIVPMANIGPRSRLRNSKLFSLMRSPSKKTTPWDPPAYDSQDWKVPAYSKTSSGDFESRYAFLKDFDTIFLVDDSSSMSGPRWREAEEAIAAIAPICTQYDYDGIDIYFLNHRRADTVRTSGAYTGITTAEDVQEIFNSVRPRGSTRVGKRLLEILTPYLHRVEMMQASRSADGTLPDPSLLVKPINIITITDGEFTDDAESVIVQVAKTLDHQHCNALPWQVGIQLFQIGDDQSVQRYLQELDDDLGKYCSDKHLRDIVDTVPWRGKGKKGQSLDADGILKCVLGAVNKKYDRRQI